MAAGRRDSSPGRLALALPSIWRKVRYRWSPNKVNSVDLGASTTSLSDALVYPWIAHSCHPQPPDARPRSLSCQLPGPPFRELNFLLLFHFKKVTFLCQIDRMSNSIEYNFKTSSTDSKQIVYMCI